MSGQADRGTILVVDDEPGICRALERYFVSEGYAALIASSGEEAVGLLSDHEPDVAFVDLRLPGIDGLSLLQRLRLVRPALQMVLITAYGGSEAAIRAAQAGACAYLPKPFDPEEAGRVVRRALRRPSPAVVPAAGPHDDPWGLVLAGPSRAAATLRSGLVERAASPQPVLLAGEFGSGRDGAARAIHARLGEVPFHPVRLAGLGPGEPDAVLAALAGEAPGLWFLAGLGDLDDALIRRVLAQAVAGGTARAPRTVASLQLDAGSEASRHDVLLESARQLGWATLAVPPLRDRREDLASLVSILLARVNAGLDRAVAGLSADALAALERHAWPGNLRELENVVEAAAMAAGGEVITATDLPLPASPRGGNALDLRARPVRPDAGKGEEG